jgi:hypothetical protein
VCGEGDVENVLKLSAISTANSGARRWMYQRTPVLVATAKVSTARRSITPRDSRCFPGSRRSHARIAISAASRHPIRLVYSGLTYHWETDSFGTPMTMVINSSTIARSDQLRPRVLGKRNLVNWLATSNAPQRGRPRNPSMVNQCAAIATSSAPARLQGRRSVSE